MGKNARRNRSKNSPLCGHPLVSPSVMGPPPLESWCWKIPSIMQVTVSKLRAGWLRAL
jgi:hypothetical protein